MRREIFRVLFALMLVLGLTLLTAVPVKAAAVTSGNFDITVSADDAVTGGTGTGAAIGTVTMEAAIGDADGNTSIVLVIQSGDYQWVDAGTADDGGSVGEGWDNVAGAITTGSTTKDTLTFADTGANTTAAVTVTIAGATIAATVGAGIEATTDVFLSYNGTVLAITNEDIGDVTEVPGLHAAYTVVTENAGAEVAGVGFTITLEAIDQFGNVNDDGPNIVTGAIAIVWTSTATGATPIADGDQTFAAGVVTTGTDWTLTNTGETPTITATSAGPLTGTSAAITVTVGATAKFTLSAPALWQIKL